MKYKTVDQSYLSDIIENDTEFLPLMSDEDEAKISKEIQFINVNNIPKERLFFAKKIINFKSLLNKKLFVFSAIGNNKNFHKSLINSGLKIKKIKSFPDHYYFKKHDHAEFIFKDEK